MKYKTKKKFSIQSLFFFFSLLLLFGSCSDKDSLSIKLKELKNLSEDLNSSYKNLNEELKKYAEYKHGKRGLFSSSDYYSIMEIKLLGLDADSYIKRGPEKGLLFISQKKLKTLSRGRGYEDIIQDETIKTQLNLSYNYSHKEKVLFNILMNLYNAREIIGSEIQLAQTDIKLKNIKKTQLINRINQLLNNYQRSNYIFHNFDANPSNQELRGYWEQQIIKE